MAVFADNLLAVCHRVQRLKFNISELYPLRARGQRNAHRARCDRALSHSAIVLLIIFPNDQLFLCWQKERKRRALPELQSYALNAELMGARFRAGVGPTTSLSSCWSKGWVRASERKLGDQWNWDLFVSLMWYWVMLLYFNSIQFYSMSKL